MQRGLKGLFAGLAVVGALALFGLIWPVVSGYVERARQPEQPPIDTTTTTFDRSGLFAALAGAGLALGDEAYVRIFKRERVLELWMRPGRGRFELFRTYPICDFSGGLGPKLKEGDHQAPEGFYRVAAPQLNPHSRHHLAFNLGFPNAFDRQLERTGSALMVHGGCSSVGCYAMTDQRIDEIYAVVEAALAAGQREVDVAIFPFRLTDAALAAEAASPWAGFWRNLKQGSDLFDATGVPPAVAACDGRYRFGADASGAGCTPITGWV